jgi:histidine ammonia-lyase
MAGPVTLDIGPLDLGVEDHATNAPAAVLLTVRALDALRDVLAVELLLADEVIRRLPATARLGRGTRAALDEVDAVRGGLPPDRAAAALAAAIGDALTAAVLDAGLRAAG